MSDVQVPIETLIQYSGNSIYKLAILVGQRALQIADQSRDLLSDTKNVKPINAALLEMRDGKIKFHRVKEA